MRATLRPRLTLQVERELADIPWELAIIGDAEAPLALTHRTVREVGNDALSRGLPGIHTPVRALIIGDSPASAMFHQLDGAYHEALEIAELYRATDARTVMWLSESTRPLTPLWMRCQRMPTT